MTWTFETEPSGGGLASATIRNPTLGDRWTDQQRQAAVESDGGNLFVQDIGVIDQFVEVGWRDLDPAEWTALRRVLLAAGYRARDINVVIAGSAAFPVPLSTGLTVDGVPLSTGQVACYQPSGIGAGDTVWATAGRMNGLRLEQSSVTLDHRLPFRGDLTLVLRVPLISQPAAGG